MITAARNESWVCPHGITFDELLQGARIGVWKGVITFDSSLGGFSGHILSKARAGVQAAFAGHPRIRRVTVGTKKVYKIRKIHSLNETIGEEDGSTTTFLDQLVDRNGQFTHDKPSVICEQPLERLFAEERRKLVEEAIQNVGLSERERDVLCRRFGIVGISGAIDPDGLTQPEIGNELGVTKQRVEQIERSALQKLRNSRTYTQRLQDVYLS